MRQRQHLPKQMCDHVEELWGPHEGCGEFMSQPEIFKCPEPSTHVLKFTDCAGWTVKNRICTFHATQCKSDTTETLRVYRYRRD